MLETARLKVHLVLEDELGEVRQYSNDAFIALHILKYYSPT